MRAKVWKSVVLFGMGVTDLVASDHANGRAAGRGANAAIANGAAGAYAGGHRNIAPSFDPVAAHNGDRIAFIVVRSRERGKQVLFSTKLLAKR